MGTVITIRDDLGMKRYEVSCEQHSFKRRYRILNNALSMKRAHDVTQHKHPVDKRATLIARTRGW